MTAALRVLIIEDSEPTAELVARTLRRGGHEIEYRRVDSPAALSANLEAQEWDLAIAGGSLGSFSGTAALSMIRGKGLDLPFFFITGPRDEEAAINAMRAGAQDFVRKDDLARLLPAVERELQQAAIRRSHRQMEQRVLQLEKFEALGKLAGGIAHDFNNVISAMMGWAELGTRELEPGNQANEAFEQIRQQAERAAGLTHQLLAFTRRQSLEPCYVDLNLLVGETVSLLQKLIGEQIEINLSLDPEIETTRADPSQIERVLMNLCLNARDAMARGGLLRIETRNVFLSRAQSSRHQDARPGPYVSLSVSDTGCGMDAGTMEHIFEPFFTTKELGKGTGLGLATALGIVKQHNGWIEVSSRPGQGSTFHVFLPASGAPPSPAGAPAEIAMQGGKETILVAEDHPGVLAMECQLLGSLGYQVLFAQDGEEAVRVFSENRENIALLLFDIAMPKLYGPDAYEKICRVRPGVPVIFTSGHTDESSALAPRGSVILQKPCAPKTIAQKVREVLDPPQFRSQPASAHAPSHGSSTGL
jgi:two-component system cell cycle sensor histidine kinase/response regulator CckA